MSEENKFSLIDLGELNDVVNNLMNKLADAVGWIACHETPKRTAINTYIDEIKAIDINPLEKAALISNAKKIIKEYSNQQNIFEKAINLLESTATPQGVDDDWLSKFMDRAKNVSSEQFQQIWAKILARECNEPGSIPVVLIYALEKMDKDDAQTFTSLCRISVKLEDLSSPIFIQDKMEIYKEKLDINFDRLLNLKAAGLIEMSLGVLSNGYAIGTNSLPAEVIYYDHKYELTEKNDISVGNVLFTKAGQALYESIKVEELEGFWEDICLPFWDN